MSPATVLNVDDDESCRYAITRILERADFRVTEAGTGEEALRIARSECPDVVLLDIHLPDINGFEVCRRLKAEPVTARIPVLHITASYMRGTDMAAGLDGGAESYLIEPVEPEVLVASIRAALRARRAEDAARMLAREWEATFDAISHGVAVVNAKGEIQRANEGMARVFGFSKSELKGLDCAILWAPIAPNQQALRKAIEAGQRHSTETEYAGRVLNMAVDPIVDDLGTPIGAVHTVHDVTERRQLEEQFREAQKFETVGTLAAGVAHDFNNLLTTILGNASLILGELPPESTFGERLQDVVRASQRAADLTKQLLAYSGKGRHFMQMVDLSRLIERIRELVEAAVPKKISIEWRLAPHLPRIEADATQIQQVILNLVTNAAEAIGEDNGMISLSTGATREEQVYLEVADTGCGMAPETISRMFDPFFTTKFTGRGLGLAAVAGIVRGHRGVIQVESSPDCGATFRVSFPATEKTSLDATAAKMDASGPPTVLVVDDEEMVRRIAKASLESRGYRVILASNGAEAIREIKLHPETAVVLLDLTMPVMGGEEAIDEIVAANPAVKVVVSTGFDHTKAAQRFNSKLVAGFLQKPYTARQLADKIGAFAAAAAR